MNEEYGKFNSAEELLKGYNQLEKSFTQKCQQLAMLQKRVEIEDYDTHNIPENDENSGISVETPPQAEQVPSTTVDSAETVPESKPCDAEACQDGRALAHDVPTDERLQQYLKDNPEVVFQLLQRRSAEFAPEVMSGGGNVSLALPSRPKTIKEASLMAKELFKQ